MSAFRPDGTYVAQGVYARVSNDPLTLSKIDGAGGARTSLAHAGEGQVAINHTTRLKRVGVYACLLLSDWNPIRLCVPSQNGLLFEPPQRHKDMTAMVAIDSPLSPLSTTGPFTM
jgi:hypothetical protein